MTERGCREVWAFDEGRFGLKVWFQRRWCPCGVRPDWLVEDHYDWRWVYAAVEPRTGHSFVLLMPNVDQACLTAFLDAFSASRSPSRIGLVLDGSGSHRAEAVVWPEHVVPLRLPAYSPELNPAERIFQHLRARLANRIFASIDDLEDALTTGLRTFWDDPTRLQRLTLYDWWQTGADAIASLTP